MALAYLARHAGDSEHRHKLVRFVRRRWTAIDEEEWFSHYWPDANPDGPAIDEVDAPDAARIQAWARDPMFGSLGPPRVLG